MNQKKKSTGSSSAVIDREIAYATTLLTLLAASGVTPYESFKRLRNEKLLPAIRKEANAIVRQVEVLGADPLSAMSKSAERTRSKPLRDLLAGYVSTVNSGGSVVSFLRSRTRSAFELQAAVAKNATEKLGAMVEAYMIMLVVAFTVYIMTIAMPVSAVSSFNAPPMTLYLLVFFGLLIVMLLLMSLTHTIWRGTMLDIGQLYKGAIVPAAAGGAIGGALYFLQPLIGFTKPDVPWLPVVMGVSLLVMSIKPLLDYQRLSKVVSNAESEMPSFLRDVAEARKTGLSPEKCIVHAARRKRTGQFSEYLKIVANQLEWGVALRNVLRSIQQKVRSWPVLVNFLILAETIEAGGGHYSSLEILAESAEKSRTIEADRRNLLKPYLFVPFLIIAALSFTTIGMVQSLVDISAGGLNPGEMQALIEVFAAGTVVNAWLTGFFTGKVVDGSFAAGFKYSALLVTTALSAILAATVMPLDVLGVI
ncbi:MAG: type II secretion system F family protein [Candidatus Bathyarchaeia archaeon]